MHTEMFTEAIIPPDRTGRAQLNPRFEFQPTEFTNDPFQIARNRRMVAISSAIEVDLTGQVRADSIGDRFYSGFGGQVDFIRGATRSDGGKPIIARPSPLSEEV